MGVIIPQVVTASRATGAQVIDGSVGFSTNNGGANGSYLKRTPSSAGNRRTWTWSAWYKPSQITGINRYIFAAGYNTTPWYGWIHQLADNSEFQVTYDAGVAAGFKTTPRYRDTGWYHVVWSHDSTQSTDTEKTKIYVNGVQVTDFDNTSYPSLNEEGPVNNNVLHELGGKADKATLEGNLSQVYFIDGQALDASYFGFTDPLTNTWKPKKYINTTTSHGDAAGVVGFGTNGFYLPFDGSAPIGQDQSGQGNDWTPVNFGGTVELDSPLVTGTRPILNVTQGGAQAGFGVFGSKQNVGYAVTVYDDGGGNKYYIDGVKQATLTGLIRGATYTFDTSDSTVSSHPFRFSESDGGSEYTNGVAAITGTATTITIPYNSSNELYYYCTSHSGMGSSITGITTNEKLADQYASNCTISLPFIGTSPVDVSASIACTTSTKTLGTNGTPTTDVSNFYASSPHLVGNASWYTLATTDDVEMGTGDYTLETYVYFHSFPVTWNYIFANEGSNTSGFAGWLVKNDGTVYVTYYDGSTRPELTSAAGSVATGRWYHLAWSRVSGTQHIFVDGVCVARGTWSENVNSSSDARWGTNPASTSTEYSNLSLSDFRIYKGVGKYTASAVGEQAFVVPSAVPDILPDTPSGVSGSSKLTKITDGAVSFAGDGGDYLRVEHSDMAMGTGDLTVEAFIYNNVHRNYVNYIGTRESGQATNNGWCIASNSGGDLYVYSNGLYTNLTTKMATKRWYHVAYVREGGTHKWYVDGILRGTDSTSRDYTDDLLTIGDNSYFTSTSNDEPLNGHISNVRVIKGTALYTGGRFTPPTAPLTNVTNTKLLCCQSNTSTTEAAVTPVSVTATGTVASNFNPFNTDINTVRGQESGYATLNPLRGELTLSDGNLHAVGVSNWGSQTADFLMSSGKWYYEYHDVVSNEHVIGIGPPDVSITGNLGSGTPPGFGYGSETGAKYSDGGNTSYGDSWTSGDVIGVAFDVDAGELSFYKNGIDQGVAFTGLTTEYVPVISINGTSRSASVNFGQKPFKFPPPDGFQPLNAANARPETVIIRPDQYVGVTTYSGNGGTKDIVVGHKPDFVWVKARDGSARSHFLYDSVRGEQLFLQTDGTAAESSLQTNTLSSFNDDGFTTGSRTGMNDSGVNYVTWTWKAGGNKNTFNVDDVGYASATAAGLTAGDTTIAGASVGTKQGFSIIKYTGPNDTSAHEVAHGLSQAPDFIITKNLDNTYNWDIYHSALGDNEYLIFTTSGTDSGRFSGRPTSTVFKTAHDYSTNENQDYIAYCWHDVPGLQKFGSFTTNSSSKEYVHLGFKPAIVWIKRTGKGSTTNLSTYGSWYVNNSEMSPVNPASYEEVLWLNRSYVEGKRGNGGGAGTYLNVDFLSDGFRLRGTANAEIGQPNDINIYCAWAEAPSVDLFGGGANAR